MSAFRSFAPLVVVLSGCGVHAQKYDALPGSEGFDATATAAADAPREPGEIPQSAELTAGAWDDNVNYDFFLSYLDEHAPDGAPTLTRQERDEANAAFSGERPPTVDLDVALLFDTTGSMSDELSYLTDELQHIAADITALAPDASVRYALVVYRDEGDAYVTQTFDFTDNLSTFRQELASQHAGGGDYPEAAAEGLEELVDLGWRVRTDVAKVAFWIGDAPHHASRAEVVTEAFRDAVDGDIRLYPVAASGVNELAELTMRSGAQVTGGRYLFLTDDSGIGDSHKEPSIPCYFVTTLHDAMVRMVAMEYAGAYVEPDPSEVIRTGGDPEDNACVLEDGSEVTAL